MASEQFASYINGKKIAASAALPGSTLAKQLEGIADGAYRVVTLTDDEHPVPDVEKPSHKLLYLTKDEDPSLLDAYTEWVYHENEWIIIGSTALNPENYKIKQDPVSDPTASGTTITAIDTITQNSNGEITATKKTIRSASTSQTGVVQLQGSIGDIETENDKAATPKAVRDAINDLDVRPITGTVSKTVTSISETDGKVSAIYEDILVGTSNIDAGAVTTEKIAAKAVTTGKLDDGAVTTAKIDNGAVTNDKLGANSVTTDKIADGTIQSGDIGAGQVTTTNIANSAVTTEKIDNDAVTGDKIASETITSDNIQNGTIQSEDIGAGQVTETNIATDAVTESKIHDNAVTTNKIANDAVTNDKVADNAINTDQLVNGAVTNDKIGHDAVNGDKIADDSIGNEHIAGDAVHSEQILDGSVTRDKIAHDAVNGDKIADNAIGNEHIADDAVHTEHILDGSVTTGKIANDAVTADKVKDGETLPVNISGNAATATTVEEGGELDQRIGALESGKKDKQEAKSDPSTSGNTENFQFISTITQNANGEITATKHTIPKSDSYTLDSSTTLATSAAVKAAVDASHSEVSGLNVENDIDAGEFITSLSQDAGLLVYSTDTMENGPVENSLKPVTGNALYEESHARTQFDDWIRPMIPGAASGQNQLVDKAYVDAIGERLEARYLSSYDEENNEYIPFPTYAAFEAAQQTGPSAFYYNGHQVSVLDNNDIVVITADERHLNEAGGPSTTRYRYQCNVTTGQDGHWYFEYVINNTALNLAQLMAINSGITEALRESYDTHLASNGHDGNPANPHRVTFDQLEGRNGVTSTELGVLDGVDTRHVGSDQLNTLNGIHIEEGVTIQSQLDDKAERVSPKYTQEQVPGYTASGKLAIIDDNADVDGRFGVEDSGAEIVANYNGNDTINPVTGSAIKEAIDALDATVDSTHQGEKVLVTVTETNGLLTSVVVDDSNAATAAQGAKADTAIQTVSVLDNGDQSAHILVPDANNGVTVDLSDYKRKQDPVDNPTSQGTSLTFIDTISQDDEGVITPTRKSVTVDGDYIVDGTNPASGTAITNALHTLEATVDSTGGTNVGVQVVEANGIITGVTVSDSSINANDLNAAINALDARVDSTGGTNVAVQVVEADGVITGVTVSDNTVNPTDLANAIDALDYTDTPIVSQFVTEVNEVNGVISVERSTIGTSDIVGFDDALSVKADKVINATDGNLATLDNTGNLVDSGKHVTSAYRDTTQEEGHEKDEYLANPVTGTAVDAAIAESASSDRQYVDEKIADLDAEEISVDGTNVQFKVTEVDGVITGVNVTTDNTINATDLSTAINALDATVATETAVELDSNKNFGISVSEENGVLTGVSIIRDNTINANDLSTAINALDATVATETAGAPAEGKNFGISVSEENGILTGVSIIRDDTVNATDVSNAISSVVNDLDAEVTSSDGTNVQVKVTEVDGVITGVNITTDNTVNATDVDTKIATEIGKLDVDNITGFGADKTLATLTETDGKIVATFQSILVGTDNIDSGAVTEGKIATDAVTEDKIGTGAVTEDKIGTGAVTEGKIDSGAVTEGKIGTGAVTVSKISTGAVTESKIGTGAVTTTKISDDAVTNDKIADNAVNTAQIVDGAVTEDKLADDAVTNSKIADDAVDTAQLVSGAVTEGKIGTGAVTETKIGAGAVTTDKIGAGAVTTAKIDDGAVTEAKIGTGAVTTTKIGDNAVTSAKIVDGAISTDKIEDSAVTTAKIDDSAVTTTKIANSAVTTAKIADDAVTTAKIADGAVTYEKVTNDPEHPFAIDISGNASTATVADIAKDVQEGSALDTRLDNIESTKADKVDNATSGNFAALDSSGNLTDSGHKHSDYKTKQTAVSDPTVPATGTTTSLSFIDTISQDTNGVITPTKKTVLVDSSYSASGTNPVNGKAISAAIGTLDVESISGTGAGKTIATLSETDGKIAATFQDIAITASQVTDLDAELSAKEDKANKVSDWSATTTDTSYPSEKLVKDSLDEKEDKSSKVTAWSVTTTDTNYPSEKLVKDSLDEKEDKTNKVSSWSSTTTNTNYPTEKLVKDSLDTKVPNTRKVNGHTLDADVTVTAADVGLGNVVNTGDSDTPVENGTTKFTTGGAYTELNKKADKTATVSNVAYDTTNKKITKTINGTTSDVVTAAKLKTDMALENVANTNITVSATDGVTDNTNSVTYKYEHPTTTAVTAAAVKVGKDALGHVVIGDALTKSDVDLGNVNNTSITVSASDGVKDNTNNVTYKYTHPAGAQSATEAAAVKVGVDATGHAIIGDALTKDDVGLGLVANQTITVTNSSVSDGTHTFNKYTHPTTTAVSAAAVKVGNDGLGHVVLGSALTKDDVDLGNVANTEIVVSATDGVTDNTNNVTYKYEHPTTTAVSAAAVKVGNDGLGHVVIGAALGKGDVGLGNVANTNITVSATDGVKDNTNNVTYKYTHPAYAQSTAAAVKVGRDSTGHVTIGAALTKSDVGLGNVTNDAQVKRSEMGVANGVATLDGDGKVPSSQLPSYIDDVVEGYYYNGQFYEDSAHTILITPTSGKVYVDLTTNLTYRWGGTASGYVKIASDLALGETSDTAYRGDRGKTAYDHSQIVSGNPHGTTKSDIGLGNVDNTSDATKKANFTGAVASGNTGFPTGDAVLQAITANGKGYEIVDGSTTYAEVTAIVDAGKIPVFYYDSYKAYIPLSEITGTGTSREFVFIFTRPDSLDNPYTSIYLHKIKCRNDSYVWNYGNLYVENTQNKVTSWSSTTTDTHYPSEKLVKTSLDNKVDKVSGKGLSTNDYTTAEQTKLAGIAAGAEVNQNAFSNVKVGDVTVAAESKTDTLEIVGSQHVTVTPDATNDKITIATDIQDQTAYTAKGSATKVPKITTNTLGQVTAIEEVTISGVTPASHTHGNITNDGKVGSDADLSVVTTTGGEVTAVSMAVSSPTASGTTLSFIDTVSQASNGKISATKKTVSTMGAASSSAAGSAGLVPAPGSGKQGAFLRGDGTWQTPTDSKVTQTLLASTTDAEYPVILKNSTTATDSPTATENYAAGITVNPKNKSVTATKFVGALEGTADTAKAYDTSFTGTNSIKSALDGKAASSHAHGNITSAGALQTTDVDIAEGDKLVITDSSNSNKVARTSTAFDGSTTTKALTPKGTFEDFAKQADIDEAIEEISTISLVGDNHITVTSDDTTGTVTVATDLSSYTAYTAKGSATKVPQITTNSLGQVTGITEVEITGVTPAAHTHGSITNDGKIGSTSGYAVYTTTGGALTAGSLAVSSPASSGNTLAFIDTVSQDSKGKITATKKAVTVDSTYDDEGTNPVNGTAIAAAIGTLDVTAITGAASKTITSISETDGKISATYSNISITKSQVSDFAHTHGNIDSNGGITATAVTVASGDSLVIVDSSDTDKKVAKSSIAFDGTTTTTALTPKGTFEAFAKSADITSAINGLDATVTSTDGTNVQVKVTEANGKITAVNVTTDNTASSTHTHGNITNDGKVGSTADLSLVTTTSGAVTTADLTTASPSVPSTGTTTALSFIDTVSQNSKGKISATKKTVTVDSTYSSTGTNPVNGKAIAAALDTLDVSSVGGAGKYISAISESNGKISATAIAMDSTPTANSTNAVTSAGILAALNGKTDKSTLGEIVVSGTPGAGKTAVSMENTDGTFTVTVGDISITKSQVSDFSHAHGNIQNGGTLQTNDIAVANGDKLVVTDYSDSAKVARTSISFDGSTTTKALTPKGTWETFNNYSHPAGSAASKTGVPTADATPGFGGSFKVNQITTDSTSHVASITERTITLPSLGNTATTAAAGNHTHATSIAASTGTNQLSLAANTKYSLTAGGTTFVFTTPKDTTYTSKTAASGGTDVSLVTTGEKWTWNHKQDALTEMTTAEVSDLVAAFAS